MTTSNIRKSIPIVRHKHRNILSGTRMNGPTNRPSNSRQLNRPATQTVRLKKNHGLIPSRNKGIAASQLMSSHCAIERTKCPLVLERS